MCKGLAIIIHPDEESPRGWRIVTQKGVKSHDELLSSSEELKAIAREDRYLAFELTAPGTLQWDYKDRAALKKLDANGMTAKCPRFGNIPILPSTIYLAVWEYLGQHTDLFDWLPGMLQAPAAMNYLDLGNENTLGNENKLGDRNTLGNENTLGNWNTLGDNCYIGFGLKFGIDFKIGTGCMMKFSLDGKYQNVRLENNTLVLDE